MANVKLKWLCFPSLRITFTYYTEQNDMIWYVKKLQWKFISIPIALFPFPYFYSHSHSHSHDVNVNVNLYSASSQKAPLMRSGAWYSHCHSHAHGNPTGPMGSQLFPFPCTQGRRNVYRGGGYKSRRAKRAGNFFCCTPQKGVQISFCAIQQGVQNHCKNYP